MRTGLKKLRRNVKQKKKRNQLIHVDKRFDERVGGININQYNQLINRIQKGRLKLVKRQSHRVSIWETIFKDSLVHLVYDNKRKTIITVLPKTKPETIGERVDKICSNHYQCCMESVE